MSRGHWSLITAALHGWQCLLINRVSDFAIYLGCFTRKYIMGIFIPREVILNIYEQLPRVSVVRVAEALEGTNAEVWLSVLQQHLFKKIAIKNSCWRSEYTVFGYPFVLEDGELMAVVELSRVEEFCKNYRHFVYSISFKDYTTTVEETQKLMDLCPNLRLVSYSERFCEAVDVSKLKCVSCRVECARLSIEEIGELSANCEQIVSLGIFQPIEFSGTFAFDNLQELKFLEPPHEVSGTVRLENLRLLSIEGHRVADLLGCLRVPLLAKLTVRDCDLSGPNKEIFSSWKYLKNLVEVCLNFAEELTSLDGIFKGYKKLRRLTLSGVMGVGVPTEDLDNLEYLNLEWFSLESLELLEGLDKLVELLASGCDLDLNDTRLLPLLRKLTIDYPKRMQFDSPQNLEELKICSGRTFGNELPSLNFQYLEKLRVLDISRSGLTLLPTLITLLKSLEKFVALKCQHLTRLNGLNELHNLKYVHASDCYLQEFSDIQDLFEANPNMKIDVMRNSFLLDQEIYEMTKKYGANLEISF